MSSVGFVTSLALAACLASIAPPSQSREWQTIEGTPQSSEEFHSSYINIPETTGFKKGDRLRFNLEGDATRVVVRLLPFDRGYDAAAGVIDKKFPVVVTSEGKYVEVELAEDRQNIKQLSVHGGPKPWNKWDLGGGNGNPILTSVQRSPPVAAPATASKPVAASKPLASGTRTKK